MEQSVLGGVAHLLNFDGSDTLSAAYYAQVREQFRSSIINAAATSCPDLVTCSYAKETMQPKEVVHPMLPEHEKVKSHRHQVRDALTHAAMLLRELSSRSLMAAWVCNCAAKLTWQHVLHFCKVRCIVQFHLNDGEPVAMSIPATEHSVMTAWRTEREALENMIEQFGTGIFACVMDSYDYVEVSHSFSATLFST